jgi:diguanylate cyclase
MSESPDQDGVLTLDGALFFQQEVMEKLRRGASLSREELASLDVVYTAASVSRTDPLTSIGNRRLFDEHLAAYVRRSQYTTDPVDLALILVDVDNFKQVNDTYGHHVGDDVLLGFAEVLAANVRGTDRPYRTGGDEFAIIIPGASLMRAAFAAQDLRRGIEEKVYRSGDSVFHVTASIGVACYNDLALENSGPVTVECIYAAADNGTFEAKKKGRNVVYAFSAGQYHAVKRLIDSFRN